MHVIFFIKFQSSLRLTKITIVAYGKLLAMKQNKNVEGEALRRQDSKRKLRCYAAHLGLKKKAGAQVATHS